LRNASPQCRLSGAAEPGEPPRRPRPKSERVVVMVSKHPHSGRRTGPRTIGTYRPQGHEKLGIPHAPTAGLFPRQQAAPETGKIGTAVDGTSSST